MPTLSEESLNFLMMNNSSGECSVEDDSIIVYKVYAGMNILMGFVACFLGTFVLSVLFMLDKHLFYYQRLIIYLNVSVILGGLVSITSINPFLVDDSGELTKSTFCTINGYLFNWSILTQHVLIWWMSIDAFILSMRNIRSLKPQNSISTIEIIAVLAAFLVPPLLLSIPALPSIDQYGPDGPLCDIQKFDFIKCEPILLGYILLCIYRFLPFSLSIIVLLSTIHWHIDVNLQSFI